MSIRICESVKEFETEYVEMKSSTSKCASDIRVGISIYTSPRFFELCGKQVMTTIIKTPFTKEKNTYVCMTTVMLSNLSDTFIEWIRKNRCNKVDIQYGLLFLSPLPISSRNNICVSQMPVIINPASLSDSSVIISISITLFE